MTKTIGFNWCNLTTLVRFCTSSAPTSVSSLVFEEGPRVNPSQMTQAFKIFTKCVRGSKPALYGGNFGFQSWESHLTFGFQSLPRSGKNTKRNMEDLVAYQERDEFLLLKVGFLKSWIFEINNNMFSNLHLVFNPKETTKNLSKSRFQPWPWRTVGSLQLH